MEGPSLRVYGEGVGDRLVERQRMSPVQTVAREVRESRGEWSSMLLPRTEPSASFLRLDGTPEHRRPIRVARLPEKCCDERKPPHRVLPVTDFVTAVDSAQSEPARLARLTE